MRPPGRPAAWRLGICSLLLVQIAAATSVSIANPEELQRALGEPSVKEIFLPPDGKLNLSAEGWPGQVLLERAVAFKGVADEAGSPPYVDANRLTELVVVGTNGSLLLSNLFLDDCLLPVLPLLCFAVGGGAGALVLHNVTLGDASCTDVSQSTAVDWLLKSAYWATWQTRWAHVDERTIHVHDTGEVASGAAPGAWWRILNSTFRCTGNETHALPDGAGAASGGRTDLQVLAAFTAVLVALLAGGYYAANRNVVNVSRDESPEVAVARSKGIVLQAMIGQGTFGRVYRGLYRGQTVAIKVIEFPWGERAAAAEVTRECQLALGCRHPNIVSCLTFFTATVRTHLRRSNAAHQLVRDGYVHVNQALTQQQRQQQGEQQNGHPLGSAASESVAQSLAAQSSQHGAHPPVAGVSGAARPALAAAVGSAVHGEEAVHSVGSVPSTIEGAIDGVMTLLLMEYCSLGNLHHAASSGRFFATRRARRPNVEWVCRTALDVAQGLTHLHVVRRLVHRDVSTNNVLLCPDPSDPRGFRAKLSDFGLATALQERQSHRSSQLKGTVDFMPPEIFTCGAVRCAVDIYGLGIIIYWLCAGEGPFTGLAPFQVVGKKLEALHRKEPLALPSAMPCTLRHLVWDCTHWDPHARPSACDVVVRLQHFLAGGCRERESDGQPTKASSA